MHVVHPGPGIEPGQSAADCDVVVGEEASPLILVADRSEELAGLPRDSGGLSVLGEARVLKTRSPMFRPRNRLKSRSYSKPLAQLALAPNRVESERHEEHAFEKVLGRSRRAAEVGIHRLNVGCSFSRAVDDAPYTGPMGCS